MVSGLGILRESTDALQRVQIQGVPVQVGWEEEVRGGKASHQPNSPVCNRVLGMQISRQSSACHRPASAQPRNAPVQPCALSGGGAQIHPCLSEALGTCYPYIHSNLTTSQAGVELHQFHHQRLSGFSAPQTPYVPGLRTPGLFFPPRREGTCLRTWHATWGEAVSSYFCVYSLRNMVKLEGL